MDVTQPILVAYEQWLFRALSGPEDSLTRLPWDPSLFQKQRELLEGKAGRCGRKGENGAGRQVGAWPSCVIWGKSLFSPQFSPLEGHHRFCHLDRTGVGGVRGITLRNRARPTGMPQEVRPSPCLLSGGNNAAVGAPRSGPM